MVSGVGSGPSFERLQGSGGAMNSWGTPLPMLPSPSLSFVRVTKFQIPAPLEVRLIPVPSLPISLLHFSSPLTWLGVGCWGPRSPLSSCTGLSSDISVSAGAWAEGLWGGLGRSLAMEKAKGDQETCPGAESQVGPFAKSSTGSQGRDTEA